MVHFKKTPLAAYASIAALSPTSIQKKLDEQETTGDKLRYILRNMLHPQIILPFLVVCFSIIMIVVGSININYTCDFMGQSMASISMDAVWITTGVVNIFFFAVLTFINVFTHQKSRFRGTTTIFITFILFTANLAFFGWLVWAWNRLDPDCVATSAYYTAIPVISLFSFVSIMVYFIYVMRDVTSTEVN